MSDTDKSELELVQTLSNLYNSAWVEGSNYKENNPEGGQIPSQREVRKIEAAKQAIQALITQQCNQAEQRGRLYEATAIKGLVGEYDKKMAYGLIDARVKELQAKD